MIFVFLFVLVIMFHYLVLDTCTIKQQSLFQRLIELNYFYSTNKCFKRFNITIQISVFVTFRACPHSENATTTFQYFSSDYFANVTLGVKISNSTKLFFRIIDFALAFSLSVN